MTARDVGDQVFNEHDLFAGEAAGEDGPCTEEVEQKLLQAVGAPASAFSDKPETLSGDLSSAQQSFSLPQTRASDTKESAAGSTKKSAPGGASAEAKPPRKVAATKRKKLKLRDCVLYYLDTKYDVLPEVIQAVSEEWQEAGGSDEDVDLLWSDHAITVERFIKMQSYQKVNHFVGMTSITRKNNLGRNLLRMKKKYPDKYRFFPDTWILPTDLSDFKMQFNGKRNKTFIVKPSDGYQGKGIFLTRDFESIPVDYNSTMVVQRYIHKPMLLDSYKFDLRLYVLVSGCDPLRIFLHEHGLVRLASEEYTEPKGKNLQRTMMHLTNYAINCDNPDFEENNNPQDGNDGHKRSLQAVLKEFEEQGMDVTKLMSEIEDLIVKTLISVQPSLAHVYHSCQPDDSDNAMCFEILGFDVLLDDKAKPWLIEVNHAPSFRTESDLDRLVKYQVLKDAFELVNITPENRQRYKREQQRAVEDRARGVAGRRTQEERQLLEEEAAQMRTEWESNIKNGYKRLYPNTTDARALEYERLHEAAVDIWETLTGSNSRGKKKKTEEDESHNGQDGARRGDRPKNPAVGKRQPGGSQTIPSAKAAADSSRSSCSSRRSRSAEKLPLAAATANAPAAKATSSSAGASALPGVAASKASAAVAKHADLQIGEVIQVQTNLGWEPVTVSRKYDNGQLDIRFADGEIMQQVMPRILKKPNAASSSAQASLVPGTSPVDGQASPGQASPGQQHRQGARSPGALGQPPPPSTRPPPMLSTAAAAASRPIVAEAYQSQILSSSDGAASASASGAFQPRGVAERSYSAGAGAQSLAGSIASTVAHLFADRATTASSSSASVAAAAAVERNTGHSSSALRPPPRLRGGPEVSRSSTDPGASSATAPVVVSGERCSTGGISGTGLVDAGADYEPSLRKKIRQALRDESWLRLRQKIQAEAPMPGPAAELEARQAKSRTRVRPLLPPRQPGWSTVVGSSGMAPRPALAIEARSVPLSSSGSRPRGSAAGEASSADGCLPDSPKR